MKYAAFDQLSIYAIAQSPEAAIAKARNEARDPEALFHTAVVREDLARWIDENGWDGKNRSFSVLNGQIIDTTDD